MVENLGPVHAFTHKGIVNRLTGQAVRFGEDHFALSPVQARDIADILMGSGEPAYVQTVGTCDCRERVCVCPQEVDIDAVVDYCQEVALNEGVTAMVRLKAAEVLMRWYAVVGAEPKTEFRIVPDDWETHRTIADPHLPPVRSGQGQ